MVPQHDPTILLFISIYARDDVPDLADLVVHVRLQTELHVASPAEVISERQTTLKTTWPDWSFQYRKDRFRSVVRDRLHWNAREVGCFFRF